MALPISLTRSLSTSAVESAVLNGEIACVDEDGWSLFFVIFFSVDVAPARPDLCFYSGRRYRSCYDDHIHLERIRSNATRLRRRLVLKTRVEKEVFHAIGNA
jgi:hypothetical protein